MAQSHDNSCSSQSRLTANMAENAVSKEIAVSEQINKRSKYKWYLNHSAPCSVAPRRSQKILKRKLAASMCADGQISGNSSEAEGEHAPLASKISQFLD